MGVRQLVEGVYEHVLTEHLERALGDAGGLQRVFEGIDDADAHVVLARHLGREIERALDSLPREQRAEHARALSATSTSPNGCGRIAMCCARRPPRCRSSTAAGS